jgi:hypothetical protein
MSTNTTEQVGLKRMKYWSELGDSEKIERMRETVHKLLARNDELEKKVRKLEEHSHQDGKIVVPLTNPFGMSDISAGYRLKSEEVYF